MSNRVIAKLKGRGVAFRQIFGDKIIYDIPCFDNAVEYDDEPARRFGLRRKVKRLRVRPFVKRASSL